MRQIGKVLCIRPLHDSPGKRDVSKAFEPGARKLIDLADGGEVLTFNNRLSYAHRRGQMRTKLAAFPSQTFDSVAVFCHGWLRGIQAGFERPQAADLCGELRRLLRHTNPVVALFCCSTGDDPQDRPLEAAGSGEGSFADALRDAFVVSGADGVKVFAHTTAGHTWRNPYAIVFDGPGMGGDEITAPGQPDWRAWRAAVKDPKGDLGLRAPWMTREECLTAARAASRNVNG